MHAPISFSIVEKVRSYNEIANLTTLKPEESSVTISYVPPPPAKLLKYRNAINDFTMHEILHK